MLPDRLAILPLLPKHKVVVEVGVALGVFSRHILTVCQPSRFIAIDLFNLHEYQSLWGRDPKDLFGGRTHADFYREKFAEHIRQGAMDVIEQDSAVALGTLEDASVDIIYVDADHSYESVKRELNVVKHKIKDDGLIILNDYTMTEAGYSNTPYGVIQAANEFMITENWEMAYFALEPYMYCDVALRKAGSSVPPVAAIMHNPDRYDTGLMSRINNLEARNASLEKALQIMRASTSWQVTAPMRALRRSLAHLKIWPPRQE